MKIIALLMTSVMSFAAIEDSWLYREFVARENTKLTGSENSIVSSLQLAGLKKEQIQKLEVSANGLDFSFENLKDEKCSGSYVSKKATFTCSTKWTTEEQKIINEISKNISKDSIFDLEIFSDSKNFVFQTKNKEVCHGTYSTFGTQFFCYTKAGVMSFFAGGDSD
jgi:hypothetical protein